MHADSKIKKRVAQAHLSIVVSISANYLNQGLQFLDLINEGNIGLMRAMDKYDESKGYHFSEYATWWIRQSITRSIADQAKLIRVPVHMWDSIGSFKRHIKKLTNELGREPSHEELATEMNMPVEKIKDIFRITHDPISVDIDV
jgi:RNA polymerase primary sigma factor